MRRVSRRRVARSRCVTLLDGQQGRVERVFRDPERPHRWLVGFLLLEDARFATAPVRDVVEAR